MVRIPLPLLGDAHPARGDADDPPLLEPQPSLLAADAPPAPAVEALQMALVGQAPAQVQAELVGRVEMFHDFALLRDVGVDEINLGNGDLASSAATACSARSNFGLPDNEWTSD